MVPTMTTPVQISMLGRFMIIHGEHMRTNSDWDRQKAASLLQRLALERRLLRDQAIDFLWPNASPEAGANNLDQKLYTLRRFLTAKLDEGTEEEMFAFHNGVLSLHSSVQVDVHEFRSLCSQIQSNNDPKQLDRLKHACDMLVMSMHYSAY
jgi:two-component SAPR family response regulator